MLRRSHKKSRQGCVECKLSRKKCDESRPACVNCRTAKKQCSYTRKTSSQSPTDTEFISYTGSDEGLSRYQDTSLNITSRDSNSSPQPCAEPYVNLLHLELFHNLHSNVAEFFINESPDARQAAIETMFRYIFSYSYLMYESLAVAALRLSLKHPSKSTLYLTESTTLQSQALSLFKSSTATITQENLIPAFLFSAILGLHFFCEIFTAPSPDLDTFLDRLVQSIRLLRGVRVMMGDSWETIKKSDISVLLQAHEGPVPNRNDAVTHAFSTLLSKISHSQSPSLSAFESKVYSEAIEGLLWTYNSAPPDSALALDGPPSSRIVTTWPITISAQYTELLDERRPEALVVMAYFSILLHGRRSFWAVGDAGRYLLAAVDEYLGERWAEWLAVPKEMVLPL
ncbi:Sterol uptake control protein [Lachnellula hyalina]|uniref:Sterol uptake control protein n=1 Tax=Lachnellula hyalina TaxID=1316788 RepID=A0A8H8TZD4_9HELO|nr:Sterol uptake control protein [Lachnellula hyalina]TVY26260.1 Sterol uptake control protein [Lachnellula hyalina]